MSRLTLIFGLLISLIACRNVGLVGESGTCFVGATIIDGGGGDPIPDGALLVHNGRVVAMGPRENVQIPSRTVIVDVNGKYITPGLINAHGHVGDVKGIDAGHYSSENIQDNLAIYARYGVTTVVSLGGDKEEAVPYRMLEDTMSEGSARLFIAGEIITGATPEEALPIIDQNDRMGVDFMKIRVDDHLGTASKMSEEVYTAVINRSHDLGYKIATHMYYLEDARKLLEAGTDLLAHSVRDLPVDAEFVQLLKEKNIAYCPTLTRELSTYVYGDTASFFSDSFFIKEYNQSIIQPLLDPKRQEQIRNSRSALIYRQQLPVAMANLKTLNDAGVPIVFGTDSGVATRFMGYFEHLEMEMMADAGMTPMQIIESATRDAAVYLDLEDLGTLTPGHWADFIVLDADPLIDIRNFRKIDAIFIGGKEVPKS
jgi:imidazolonepropionase-like amidohydrolase